MTWKGAKENCELSLTTATKILTGLLVANLAQLAVGFSFWTNHASSLIREIDQQLGQKSIWAKSHLINDAVNGFTNSFTSRHCWTKAFPDRNGYKRAVAFPNENFSRMIKPKKCPSGFENLSSESAHKHHGTPQHTNNPWLCILHPTAAAWASSSAYQGLARCKMKNSYQNDVNKFKSIP